MQPPKFPAEYCDLLFGLCLQSSEWASWASAAATLAAVLVALGFAVYEVIQRRDADRDAGRICAFIADVEVTYCLGAASRLIEQFEEVADWPDRLEITAGWKSTVEYRLDRLRLPTCEKLIDKLHLLPHRNGPGVAAAIAHMSRNVTDIRTILSRFDRTNDSFRGACKGLAFATNKSKEYLSGYVMGGDVREARTLGELVAKAPAEK